MGHIYGAEIRGKGAEFLVNLIHIQKLVLIIDNFAVRYAAPDSYRMIDSIFMSLNIQIIPMIHVVFGPIIRSLYLKSVPTLII